MRTTASPRKMSGAKSEKSLRCARTAGPRQTSEGDVNELSSAAEKWSRPSRNRLGTGSRVLSSLQHRVRVASGLAPRCRGVRSRQPEEQRITRAPSGHDVACQGPGHLGTATPTPVDRTERVTPQAPSSGTAGVPHSPSCTQRTGTPSPPGGPLGNARLSSWSMSNRSRFWSMTASAESRPSPNGSPWPGCGAGWRPTEIRASRARQRLPRGSWRCPSARCAAILRTAPWACGCPDPLPKSAGPIHTGCQRTWETGPRIHPTNCRSGAAERSYRSSALTLPSTTPPLIASRPSSISAQRRMATQEPEWRPEVVEHLVETRRRDGRMSC